MMRCRAWGVGDRGIGSGSEYGILNSQYRTDELRFETWAVTHLIPSGLMSCRATGINHKKSFG